MRSRRHSTSSASSHSKDQTFGDNQSTGGFLRVSNKSAVNVNKPANAMSPFHFNPGVLDVHQKGIMSGELDNPDMFSDQKLFQQTV